MSQPPIDITADEASLCRCPHCLVPARVPVLALLTPDWPIKCHHCQQIFFAPIKDHPPLMIRLACHSCDTPSRLDARLWPLFAAQPWPISCQNCGTELDISNLLAKEAEESDAEMREDIQTLPASAKLPPAADPILMASAVLGGFCVAGLAVLYLRASGLDVPLHRWMSDLPYQIQLFTHQFFQRM